MRALCCTCVANRNTLFRVNLRVQHELVLLFMPSAYYLVTPWRVIDTINVFPIAINTIHEAPLTIQTNLSRLMWLYSKSWLSPDVVWFLLKSIFYEINFELYYITLKCNLHIKTVNTSYYYSYMNLLILFFVLIVHFWDTFNKSAHIAFIPVLWCTKLLKKELLTISSWYWHKSFS